MAEEFDPHHRLLIAVLNIGGNYNIASDAGRLLDFQPRPCVIDPDLHRSLRLMGFTFYDHVVPLGQGPEFYQILHAQLAFGLRVARINPILLLPMIMRPNGRWPFVARINPAERQRFSTIILDNKLFPLWEEEDP
jgi:hypothetical protein